MRSKRNARLALAASALLLAACDQSNAPSESVGEAAEEIVAAVSTDAPAAPEEPGAFEPRHECGDLKGAPAFMSALRAAAQLRDPDLLAALTAEDVKLDFGGGAGRAELRRRLDDPEYELWAELDEVLALGCAANGQAGITLPWYFAQEFQDPYQSLIVTGDNVAVYADPDPASPRVASLSWELVQNIPAAEPSEGFVHVRLPGEAGSKEQQGYISADKLRSVLDYRIVASSRNDRWRITSFVAGD